LSFPPRRGERLHQGPQLIEGRRVQDVDLPEAGDLAHFAAEAARLSATPVPPSPEAEHFRALAKTYRGMGGAAYEAGLVQRAEEMARKYEPAVAIVPPPDSALARHLRYGKPIEAFLAGR
jgi:hypothetical protein